MLNFVNPYNGEQGATCSVSFSSIVDRVSVGEDQSEAQFHRAKLMGEWGVVKAKVNKKEIPNGTKVLTFEGLGISGYSYVKDGKLRLRRTQTAGKTTDIVFDDKAQKAHFQATTFKWSIPKTAASSPGSPSAGPTPRPPIAQGSKSTGSMTDEKVSVVFVKVKDRLAEEKGVGIRGTNASLDAGVHDAIGEKTGYTGPEVRSKVDAYKASGQKLAPLKGSRLSREDRLLVEAVTRRVKVDKSLYSNEDIAAVYVMAKEQAEGDEVYALVHKKTGFTAAETDRAVAAYLSDPSKKLSNLKRSLVQSGRMKESA